MWMLLNKTLKMRNQFSKLKKKDRKSGDIEVHRGFLYNYRHRIGIMLKSGNPTTVLFNEALWKRTVLPTFAMENDKTINGRNDFA